MKLSFVEAGNGLLLFGSSNWSAMVASIFGSHVHDVSSMMRIRTFLFMFPRGSELRSQLLLSGELLARGYSTQHPEDKTSYKNENKRI